MGTIPKELIREIAKQENIRTAQDLNNYFKDLLKEFIQELLEAEMEAELGYSKGDRKNKNTDNRRNGYTEKTVKTSTGEMELEIPRGRNGEFEPIIAPKNKRDIAGMEDKIILLYARGNERPGYT